MAQPNTSTQSSIFIPSVTDRAFEAILPEMMAFPDAKTIAVTLDVVAAATTVLGLVPALNTLREQIAELPRFDLQRFDKLEQYAFALIHIHGKHRGAQLPKGHIAELGSELAGVRDRFFANAMSLADMGLLDGARLAECKTAIGYRATAIDVITIASVLKESWPDIEGKTWITPAAMLDAQNKAIELLTAVGLRAQNAEVVGEHARLRSRAWTLLLRAYEDARHAVEFVRRAERDANEFAPSLFAGRGGRRREEEQPDAPTQAPPATTTSAAASKSAATKLPLPMITDNPEGLPLDSPYTSN